MEQKGQSLYVRLSAMMFLQFAAWGAWSVMIAGHMESNLKFTGIQIAMVFGTTAWGSILSPMIAGWIADRYMAVQRFTAIMHAVGAVLLLVAWKQTTFGSLWTVMLLYAFCYMPTIALTNAIAFHHMGDSEKFGNIRVWGTIGWIAVQWGLAFYLNVMRGQGEAYALQRQADCLLFGAVASILMALYSLSLPDTPPTKDADNPYAFLEAFALAKANRNFAILLGISFLVAIELPFYYNLTFLFLTDAVGGVGLTPDKAQFAMTLGQIGEVALMFLLFMSLKRIGMRGTITLGILAWPLRYVIFAIGEPAWLVIAAQTLHGICYAFFFVGGMIAAEKLAHKDIRASAQGLMVFATNGVGMLVGHFVSGAIHDAFALPDGGWQWAKIFLLPILLTIVAAGLFWTLFNERKYQEDAARVTAEDAGLTGLPGSEVGAAEAST